MILSWLSSSSSADEGMWLPMLIKKMNYTNMQKLGLKLSAEEIYSVNNGSLKDAIVNFGNFCTGEVISGEGLLLTNHHCGYDAIQSQSSVESNFLDKGFWAKNKSEEKPTPGLTVTFLVRMEDVSTQIMEGIGTFSSEQEREEKFQKAKLDIESKAIEGTHYTAEVKSFFEGNEYYLFVYETFKDIRWVGAPPNSIGKFGGDTDNWMWPRHTGDFSLFRIYAAPDGKPADYNSSNVPLKPRHFLPISLKGLKKNDFTMILGYPGSTDRYLPSAGVKLTLQQSNPMKIAIRKKKLEMMKYRMDESPEVKIKYAAKYAHISNYYKYFIGQNKGLNRLKVYQTKQNEEEKMKKYWESKQINQYKDLLPQLENAYLEYSYANPLNIYLEEALLGSETILFAFRMNTLYSQLKSSDNNINSPLVQAALNEFKGIAKEHFKNFDRNTDYNISATMFQMYYNDINKRFHPSIFADVEKKYKKSFPAFFKIVFEKSFFTDANKMNAFLEKPSVKEIEKDITFKTMQSILNMYYGQVSGYLDYTSAKIDSLSRIYTHSVLEMKQNENLYPNANFTMRLTYGSVQDYFPQDAVHYNFFTTIDGIMEKEDSTNEEFIVPAKLKQLYQTKNYGRYAENGTVPICFISNNDITGGNSGSPVINAEGHLVGTAFDGNWEAMSGDIAFEPQYQRTISTDIRYVLFIIDKYAEASNIINELKIID
jgi:hypothetical protein